MRLPTVIFLLAALQAPLSAQAPADHSGPDSKKEALIALGASLFADPRLSSTGTMSCATCHHPERSFTEDKPRAIGQTGLDLGRNTPTLFGLASVKEFPVGSGGSPPKMVSLEERCVVPLRDGAEMCGRVGEATERLSKDAGCVATFEAVFQEPWRSEPAGVTGDRIAKALAEYVRSLRHWEGPTHAALAGVDLVLDKPVKRGLDVFRGEGRCQSCHSGPALTDGNLYVVSLRTGPTAENARIDARGELTTTDSRPRPESRVRRPRMAGGYGRTPTLERQTLTLLDVGRTGPYFRDGSVAILSDAVRQHVKELREIGSIREAAFGSASTRPDRTRPRRPEFASLSLSATRQLSSDSWVPNDLTAEQLDDVVAFLGSLSPRD